MKQEILFAIRKSNKFWVAKCINEDIFTQGQTIKELICNIKEATALHLNFS